VADGTPIRLSAQFVVLTAIQLLHIEIVRLFGGFEGHKMV